MWWTIKMRARHSDQEFDSRLIRSWTMANEITRTFSIKALTALKAMLQTTTTMHPQKSNKVNIVSTEFEFESLQRLLVLFDPMIFLIRKPAPLPHVV